MSNLLYFFPGAQGDCFKLAQEYGLGLEEASGHNTGECLGGGPGGRAGVVLGAKPNPPAKTGYYPEEQTWVSCAGGKFWVGWLTESPPAPEDLMRQPVIPGYSVPLGDGNIWAVPTIRVEDGSSYLPQSIVLDEAGQPVEESLPKHSTLIADATTMFTALCNQYKEEDGEVIADPIVREVGFKFDLAVRALALNYRVGKWEVGALRLFDTTSLSTVCMALTDFIEFCRVNEALKDAAKKTSPASTPATAPS